MEALPFILNIHSSVHFFLKLIFTNRGKESYKDCETLGIFKVADGEHI